MRRALLLLAVALGAVLLAALVLGTGTPAVAPHRLPAVLGAAGGIEHVVVTELRVPRLLLGVLTGAALGLAGLLLQDGLRNPLAVPELLGVSSGAAAAVAVTIVTGAAVPFAPLLPAVVGAVTGGALTLLAVRGAVGPAAVLLIGAGVGAALQALLLAAVAMTGSSEQGVLVRYLLGSLTGTTWATVTPVLPALAVAFVAGVAVLPLLGPLRLGDDAASALGLHTGAARAAVLGVACLLVAAVVGPAGPVAWVGFLAPQLVRVLLPAARPLPRAAACAGAGAAVVVVADLLARTVLYPVELPVGGFTAGVAIVAGGLLLVWRRPRAARTAGPARTDRTAAAVDR
ncbi:iron chelate uptake ABC transporter family permease subunit [Pseudonocardia sp. ICBG162]|uniref:iron chelate uptake ABC transporter family permease subunit n=1 Tax=Pseudonocardia sp. ICBG162 TaxID=2846761 RepID=UPI001CF69D6E|nr:iron chelate uptake ABC transporter family permease subunit [Pseudonocardia sp. ICBG162]